ncbi:MAG: hypothetical protein K2P86_05725 [Xanthobacteraceae bacterium]|nr:hypothetical protein [Xanthobacteraceae bacterium]
MRRPLAFFSSALILVAAVSSVSAQQIVARTPQGAAAVETTQSENGVQLTITVGSAEPQVFDGVGDVLVPIRAGNRSAPVIAFDIDRDGTDEIFVRTSTQGQRGVLIVFRWNAGASEYAPVTFAEDTGAPKPYLIVHLSQQVLVSGTVVEANHDSTDGGRKRLRVFRYRWNGSGFVQTADH